MYLALILSVLGLSIVMALTFYFLKKITGNSGSSENSGGNEEGGYESDEVNDNNDQTNSRGENGNENERLINTNSRQEIVQANRNTNITDANLTKKDMKKMEKKKMKEEQREYQKQMLEAKKLREQEKEREYLEKDRKREEERQKEEEILKKLKDDQEKKENEIFDQWKDKFNIMEEGEEHVDINNEDLINDFINYIKLRKVVALEDLSGQFKINSNELIERLKSLEDNGRICGIIDDRGKYIYLTDKELASIEKIFMNRGRISKAELIKECNKIIKFQPTEEDKQKILEQQNKMLKSFEEELEKNNNAGTTNTK